VKVRYVLIASGLAGVMLGVGISWAEFGSNPPLDPARRLPVAGVDGAPKLVVDQMEHDFGVIDPFNNVKHAFRITNIGTGTLTLKAGTTTCTACTIAEVTKSDVPPGETAKVIVEYSPRRAKSEFQQYATVLTNDPEQTRLELKILGSIRRKFRTLPEQIVLSNVSANESVTADVKIISFMSDHVNVVDYRFKDNDAKPFFEAKAEAIGHDQLVAIEPLAKSGCRVLVTLKPGLPLGPFRQTIFLTLDTGEGGERTDFDVPIEGTVVSDLSIVGPGWLGKTGVLSLGNVNRDQGTKRELNLLVRGDARHDVAVEPIKLDPPWLRVTMGKPAELNASVVRIPFSVEIPPGSPSAVYRGTNLGKYAEITLGIKNHPDAKELLMHVTFVTGNEN
jgi:Protein of unknown function (DUF1573)